MSPDLRLTLRRHCGWPYWRRLICYPKVSKICELLKANKNKEAIKMITQIRGKKTKETTDNLLNYIDYASYKDHGWYVGSCAIESGNKSMIQFREK
ncbi:MAG: hypothetical protein LBV23_08425 [Deltaproteobacteria bacterium]|jgi:hypothetical protein|nr:hypothetical protein [Deltaproteobacteria bacterium]